MENITGRFNVGPYPSQARIGVITFSDSVNIEFNLGENLEEKETISAVRRINYLSGGTNTASALRILSDVMFRPENGGRMNASHVALVITDGESHDINATAAASKRARDQGIRILTIGVGPNVDEEELKLIASDPDDHHVFKVTSYRTLQQIADAMVERTCEGKLIIRAISTVYYILHHVHLRMNILKFLSN